MTCPNCNHEMFVREWRPVGYECTGCMLAFHIDTWYSGSGMMWYAVGKGPKPPAVIHHLLNRLFPPQ